MIIDIILYDNDDGDTGLKTMDHNNRQKSINMIVIMVIISAATKSSVQS